MTLRDYIRRNREDIDATIRSVVPDARINDEERRMWVMNDEGLYRQARRAGWRG